MRVATEGLDKLARRHCPDCGNGALRTETVPIVGRMEGGEITPLLATRDRRSLRDWWARRGVWAWPMVETLACRKCGAAFTVARTIAWAERIKEARP